MFNCVMAPNTLRQMEHLWHDDSFRDLSFVLTFTCGKFYVTSLWNQFKNKVSQGLERIPLKLLRPQTAVPCPGCRSCFLFRNQFLPLHAHSLDGNVSCPIQFIAVKRKTFYPCRNSWMLPDIRSAVVAGCIMCQQRQQYVISETANSNKVTSH